MSLISRLVYEVWNESAAHEGSASRQKNLRPAKYTSMVVVDSPWAPTWAMNKVTFSTVIG